MKKKHFADLIVIAALLITAGVLFLVSSGRDSGQWAVVAVEGQEIGRYDLTVNGTYELNGGSNTLVIEDGAAYLCYANCPDHLCVKQGKIHASGQMITCLPNKLTVTVEGVQGDVDLVVS